MSHFFNDGIEGKYYRLCSELDALSYDVFLLLNVDDKTRMPTISKQIRRCVYDMDDLNTLGYTPINESLLPGSCHFPVLMFYMEHPNYSFYWFIEYDVEFTAPWSVLMNAYGGNMKDYIVPFWARYDSETNRQWLWWQTKNNAGFPLVECLRSFHPICRYSNRALNVLDKYQKKGFSAHSEVIVPTCLYHAGLTLATFPEADEHVRYRPTFSPDEFKQKKQYGKLYHPIKFQIYT